jgi:serine/threonine protein kinase
MKTIKKNLLTNEKEKKHMQQEIDIMSSLHHPHIISVYDGKYCGF